jgi:hypothetical protein
VAEELQISGTPARAKVRSPVWTAVLVFVTLHIYFFFWWYFINREMRDLGRARGSEELGDSPGKSLLAVTLGALVIVPALISIYNTGKRIQAAQRLAGREDRLNGWLALVLFLVFSPVMDAYFQSELNKVWQRLGEPVAAVEGAAPPSGWVGPGSIAGGPEHEPSAPAEPPRTPEGQPGGEPPPTAGGPETGPPHPGSSS